MTTARLIDARLSDGCGCPEEDWIIDFIDVTIHIEPDGSGEIFVDAGDWQAELTVACAGIEELRSKAIEYIQSLPKET